MSIVRDRAGSRRLRPATLPICNRWNVSTIGTTGSQGSDSSLAFGLDDQPAIAYHSGGGQLFARFSGTGWSTVIADNRDEVWSDVGPSLAFGPGPDGRPAIAYSKNGELCLARFAGTAWNIIRVDQGDPPSLAFGPDGRPAMAFGGSHGLRFAQFDGTRWIATTVDPHGERSASVAFGPL